MYAIVEIKGKQYKVREGDTLYVPRINTAPADDALTFDRVLLFANDDAIHVGTPTVDGAQITAQVLDHVKGDKVLVFKKRRRKRYNVLRGHRQQYTQVRVEALSLENAGRASKKKKAQQAAPEPAEDAVHTSATEATEA